MFIGEKKVKDSKETGETTPSGVPLVEVQYVDGTAECLSKLMFDQVLAEKACDLTELREKRLEVVLRAVLELMRDWGLRVGETPYFGALLNQSLNYSVEEATKTLWATVMLKPLSLDDVDLVTVDRVLKNKSLTAKDVIGE